MCSSTSDNGLWRSVESSGSGSSLLVRRHLRPTLVEVESNVSLRSLATEEDDEVQFDSE